MHSFEDESTNDWNAAEGKDLSEDWDEPPADDPNHGLFVMAKQA